MASSFVFLELLCQDLSGEFPNTPFFFPVVGAIFLAPFLFYSLELSEQDGPFGKITGVMFMFNVFGPVGNV